MHNAYAVLLSFLSAITFLLDSWMIHISGWGFALHQLTICSADDRTVGVETAPNKPVTRASHHHIGG